MSSYSSEEYEDRGRTLLRSNRAQEALEAFEEGARRFPGDEDLLMGTAMARLKLGDAAGAAGVLEGMRRTADVLEGLVEAYLGQGLPERAAATAQEAAEAAGDDARAAYRLGRALYGRKRYRDALGLYERGAKLSPEWSEAWFGLGACQWALKQSASAEAALRRAVELAPDDWQARQFLGCVLCDLGRKAEAKEMLESVPLDASWQKPALERLVALSWWPSDGGRSREMEALWRRTMGGAPAKGAQEVLEEVSRRLGDPSQ